MNSLPLHHIVDLIDTILDRPEPFELDCFTNDKDKSIIKIDSFDGQIDITYHTHPKKLMEFDYRPWTERTQFCIDDTKFNNLPPKFYMPDDDVIMAFFNRIELEKQVTNNVNYTIVFNKNDKLAERMLDLTFLMEECLGHPLPSHIWDLYK